MSAAATAWALHRVAMRWCRTCPRRAFTPQEMIDANVAVSRGRGQLADRFYDRVMFPIFDEQGHNIAFGGRIMGDGQPKYLNTAETSVVP